MRSEDGDDDLKSQEREEEGDGGGGGGRVKEYEGPGGGMEGAVGGGGGRGESEGAGRRATTIEEGEDARRGAEWKEVGNYRYLAGGGGGWSGRTPRGFRVSWKIYCGSVCFRARPICPTMSFAPQLRTRVQAFDVLQTTSRQTFILGYGCLELRFVWT